MYDTQLLLKSPTVLKLPIVLVPPMSKFSSQIMRSMFTCHPMDPCHNQDEGLAGAGSKLSIPDGPPFFPPVKVLKFHTELIGWPLCERRPKLMHLSIWCLSPMKEWMARGCRNARLLFSLSEPWIGAKLELVLLDPTCDPGRLSPPPHRSSRNPRGLQIHANLDWDLKFENFLAQNCRPWRM